MSGSGSSLQDVSFSFKDICGIANNIKPEDWCIVATNQRLSFVEIALPQFGPATLQRQLILNNYMQVEAYVGTEKICEESLNTNDIQSVPTLEKCLKVFASFGICLGNRNFHRNRTAYADARREYWRHSKCLLLYEKDDVRGEQCCDTCVQLDSFLTKKRRQKVMPYRSSEGEDSPNQREVK